LLAGAAAIAPVPETWPFISGVGGFIGDGLLNGSASLLGLQKNSMPIAILIGVLGTCIYVFALGLSLDRLNEAGRVAARYFDRLLDALDRVPLTVPDSITEKLPAAWLDKVSQEEIAVAREEPSVEVEEIDDDEVEEDVDDFEDEYDELEDDTSPTRNIIRAKTSKKKSKREASEAQPRFPIFSAGDYQLPALNFFAKPPAIKAETVTDEALEKNARMLETVLADFNVRGEIINVRPGPVVTLYELEPAAGVKSSRVIGLADDIARSMSAIAARVAVIPGRNAIGIELPNQSRETVFIREMLGAPAYENSRGDLTLALGKSIGGEPIFADLSRMPHLLIAGTTGSGKSVGINGMILSLLYRLAPDQCKLIMIDPKMLELSVYEGIPHLLSPVVTDPRKAVVALKWTVKEMEERYRRMSKVGVRNITGFNQRVEEAAENGETLSRTVHTGYDEETGEPVYETEELDYETMPFIVVIIDEVADLMMVAGKDIEAMVQRLAQMARAAGIHLIMATQRPSVDVITGTIKANFPTRISFQVTSKIDSRTILGEQGAEQLLGQGDMLHMAGGGRITRVHGAFVSDDEVEKVVDHLKKQGKPDYVQEVTEMGDDEESAIAGLDIGGNTSSGDALYDKAVAVVMRDRKASTSYIQRRLQIGYNRAATLIERMEDEGVVSSANHAGKRQILVGEDAA
ncbi:MAG: DNA translocase FtsK, partial [Pseudomonadota bacterium]